MFADFQNEYSELTDDELLQLAAARKTLTDDATFALDAEMRSRALMPADLAKYQTFVRRNEQLETVRRNKRLFGSPRSLMGWIQFARFWLLVMAATASVAIWLTRR